MKKPAKGRGSTAKPKDSKTDHLKKEQPEQLQAGQFEAGQPQTAVPTACALQDKVLKADALKGLCDGFVNSAFYKRAMTHPGYLREEAIRAEVVGLSDLT